jgi:hypothetical protein
LQDFDEEASRSVPHLEHDSIIHLRNTGSTKNASSSTIQKVTDDFLHGRGAMKCVNILMAGLVTLVLSTPVFAQSEYGGGWAVPSLDTTSRIMNEVMNRKIVERNMRRGSGTSEQEPARPAGRAANAPPQGFQPTPPRLSREVLIFTPSLERRQQNMVRFIAKSRGPDPQAAQQFEQVITSPNFFPSISTSLVPYGFKIDNLADAYAVYWTNAWLGSQGRVDKVTREQAQAVKRQAESALLASPAMARATAAQKQEFAEALLIQAAIISSSVADARSNPQKMRQFSEAVVKGARAMGLDLRMMTLTEDGFIPA